MTFARRVFRFAGIYGLIVLPPQYFLETRIGRDAPPPITHPEFFYGFLGVAIAWQVAFLIIALDPRRYRPLMLAGVIEKSSFGIAAVAMNVVSPVWSFPADVLRADTSMLGRLDAVVVPVALLVAWVVVLGTLLPFGVELVALRHLSASTVTMVAMLEPVGVAVLGWWWFQEDLGPVATAGCALVLAGIVAAQTGRPPHPLPEPPHLAGP